MAAINVGRIFETSKILATKAGQEIRDFVDYSAAAFEQVVRALRNGLTFADNFDAKYIEVELVNDTVTGLNTGAKRPKLILPCQVISLAYGWDSFHWYIDGAGQTKCVMGFTGTPGTTQIKVVLLIVYG